MQIRNGTGVPMHYGIDDGGALRQDPNPFEGAVRVEPGASTSLAAVAEAAHDALHDAVHGMANELASVKFALDETAHERDALRRFKDYVHKRLDDAGVPTHPNGPHSAEGCRIGDRLDFVLTGRSSQ